MKKNKAISNKTEYKIQYKLDAKFTLWVTECIFGDSKKDRRLCLQEYERLKVLNTDLNWRLLRVTRTETIIQE